MGFNTPSIDNLRISSRITSDWVLSVTSQNLVKCSYSLSDTRVVTCFMLSICFHFATIIRYRLNKSKANRLPVRTLTTWNMEFRPETDYSSSHLWTGKIPAATLGEHIFLYCSGAERHPVSLIKLIEYPRQ